MSILLVQLVNILRSINCGIFLFPNRQFQLQINSVFYSMEQSLTTGKKLAEEQQQSKTELFESVIAKYFEIIKTILPRISTLYLQNQQMERNLFTLESKMAKIEKDHENLHYQMRANHLSIDNKLNHILSDYSFISNEYSRIKQQNDDLCREVREIKNIQATQKQVVVERQEEIGVSQFKKQKYKKITFLQNYSENQQESSYQPKQKKALRFLDRKSSIDDDVEELSGSQMRMMTVQNTKSSDSRSMIEPDSAESQPNSKGESQKSFDFTQRKQAIAMKSQKVMLRKTNLKSTSKGLEKEERRERVGSMTKSQKVLVSKSDELDSTDKYKEILREIKDFYKKNESMKKNYEYLMGEYCRSNEQQYAKIQQQINQLRTKIAEIDILHTHFEKVKIQLENKITTYHKETESKINTKLDAKLFHQFVEETNSRLTAVHEERRKLANKEEMKKALEFLEKKLNFVIDQMVPDNEQKYPRLHLVDLEISHLTARVTALPIHRPKGTLYSNTGDKTAKNSQHSTRHATVQTYTTKRQAESFHNKVRSDKQINQQQLSSIQKQKKAEGNNSWRGKRANDRDNLAYLRDRSRELLSRGDKTKTRTKLKKERILFEYD